MFITFGDTWVLLSMPRVNSIVAKPSPYKKKAPAPATTANAENPTAKTDAIPSARTLEMAPEEAEVEAAAEAPLAADEALVEAAAAAPDDSVRRAVLEAVIDPDMDPEADEVMAELEPLIEPVAEPALETASDAIPLPTEEKV